MEHRPARPDHHRGYASRGDWHIWASPGAYWRYNSHSLVPGQRCWLRAIGGIDTIFGHHAEHLIGLLIILMRPHIWLKRGRQGIKGDAFQPISKGDLTEDRE